MDSASFGSRFIAYLIDEVALVVLAWVILIPFGMMAGLASATESSVLGLLTGLAFLIMFPILILLQFIYFGYLWSGYAVSGFFFGLGFIWAAFDANGEAWHDKIFATRVVRA
jgi:uncharacterized RDD family membrane protein YckC